MTFLVKLLFFLKKKKEIKLLEIIYSFYSRLASIPPPQKKKKKKKKMIININKNFMNERNFNILYWIAWSDHSFTFQVYYRRINPNTEREKERERERPERNPSVCKHGATSPAPCPWDPWTLSFACRWLELWVTKRCQILKDMTPVLKVQCVQVIRKKKKLQRLLLSKRCRVQGWMNIRVK